LLLYQRSDLQAATGVHGVLRFRLHICCCCRYWVFFAAVAAGDASQQQRVQQLVLKVTNAVHSNIPGFLEVCSMLRSGK
jgi:hypothetical protein